MKIIGLTGPSGTGKTTLSDIATSLGYAIIDCDKVAREVTTNPQLLSTLENEFGGVVINGVLDRKALAEKAFANKDSTERLNSIMLPIISAAIDEKIEKLKIAGVEYLLLSSGRIIELGETYANKSYKLYGLDDTGNIVKESEPDFDGFEGDEWIHQAWESFDQMQIDPNYQLEELTFFADHYTGFVDLHPYQNQRLNPVTIKDYDGDGLNDRLFQRYNEGKNTHEVYLFFGSGEMLRLDSNVYTMMYGADAVDLTGDGINELLFTHHIIAADDNGTTFFSIFTKTNGSWERMKLPGEGWTYEYGFASSYRETFRLDVVDDQTIKVSHPDCGSSADLTVSKYVMDLEVRGMQGAQSDDSVISAKEISVELNSGLGYDVLRLYGRIGDRWESTGFSWLLGYVDGDWKVLAVENK